MPKPQFQYGPRSINANDPRDQKLIESWIIDLKTGRRFVYGVHRTDDPSQQTTYYKVLIFEALGSAQPPNADDYAVVDLLIGALSSQASILQYSEKPGGAFARYELSLELAISYQASHALQIHQGYAQGAQAQQLAQAAQAAAQLLSQTFAAKNVSIQQLQKFMGITNSLDLIREPLPVEHSTEALVGYRDFDLDVENMLLKSRNGALWEPKEKLVALCGNDPFAKHDAPAETCACGIYAFDKPDNQYLDKNRNIWGEVYLWGEVLVCKSGFRAEFAYPKSIFVRDSGTRAVKRLAEHLEDEYGVPTLLMKERTGQTLGEIMEKMIQELTEAK